MSTPQHPRAQVSSAPALDHLTSWHHHRDGMGSVIGPRDPDGLYPILVNGGITYEDAVARFGPEVRRCGPEPITVDIEPKA
jgi:hypothetical protein